MNDKTTLIFYIDPMITDPGLIDGLLQNGTCIECVAYDNGKHFDRDASLLLEDTVLADKFTQEVLLDDTAPHVELTVCYPHLDYNSAAAWVEKLRAEQGERFQEIEILSGDRISHIS